MHAERLIERTEARRARVSDELDAKHRASWGQFFTPAPVAQFLAALIEAPAQGRLTVLDPGAGVGSLSAALAGRAIAERWACEVHVVAFEADPALFDPLRKTMRDCQRSAESSGVSLSTEVRDCDFLDWASEVIAGALWANAETFDACVMNPPYRKINNGTAERLALERIGLRVTNLYAAFMGAAAALLTPGGQLSAITPRSFANGPYFLPFRRFFLSRMALDRLHVYDKRGKVFADAQVLQENVILRATRTESHPTITLSTSESYEDAPISRVVPYNEVVGADDPQLFIHIPIDEHATLVASRVTALPASLDDLGIKASTGRVVDFRTRENLRTEPEHGAAPLIYPSHVKAGAVTWPILGGKKPNALAINEATSGLLLPAEHYTLVKRFTAKEERRRVVASVFEPDSVPSDVVAFENHLNVFHRRGAGIEPDLAVGLAFFLNSSTVDAYVRQFSGHTQINATDLRLLRYPDLETLLLLGAAAGACGRPSAQEAIDALVENHIPGFRDELREARAA